MKSLLRCEMLSSATPRCADRTRKRRGSLRRVCEDDAVRPLAGTKGAYRLFHQADALITAVAARTLPAKNNSDLRAGLRLTRATIEEHCQPGVLMSGGNGNRLYVPAPIHEASVHAILATVDKLTLAPREMPPATSIKSKGSTDSRFRSIMVKPSIAEVATIGGDFR